MEKEIEDRVGFYCEIFKAAYERILKVYPEGVRDVALKILEEIARDLRDGVIRAENKVEEKPKAEERSADNEHLATKNQRKALHKFGVKMVLENLSFREASEVLDRLIGFSREGESESIAKLVEELNRRWGQQ
ncbi:MAG: hypothetical protein ABIM42_07535 [candidate division WOR-3 bacterium]